jgi:deoxyribose-phosphate aldolase
VSRDPEIIQSTPGDQSREPAIDPARIDHTCLRPDATPHDIARLCAEARTFRFKTVCVQPTFVAFASRALAGSGVGVSAVVAFPHGASTTATKVFEARTAVADGATELDVVANLGWIRGGDAGAIEAETRALVDGVALGVGAREAVPIKLILESTLFSPDDLARAARAGLAGGAAFLKTSTGFAGGGGGGGGGVGRGPAAHAALLAQVALLRAIAGPRAGVKASGGIRTRSEARALLTAGADRLGCSASVELVDAPGP